MKKGEKTVEVMVVRPFCIGYDQTRYEPGRTYKLDQAIAERVIACGLAKLKTGGQTGMDEKAVTRTDE